MSRQTITAGKAVIVVDVVDKATLGFNKIANSLRRTARSLRDLGTNAAGAGLLSGLAVGGIVNNFIKFEDKILTLSAKLGYFGVVTEKQQETLTRLQKTIIDIGKASSYTSQEVADAAIALAAAGFSANELEAALQPVVDLARGTNFAVGEAAEVVANTERVFKLFAKDDSLEQRYAKITQMTSMFVTATRLGTIELEDIRQSLKYSTGNAKGLGIELSTLLGVLVQMSESGLKASLGGTSLNTALSNMIRTSKVLKKELPDFRLMEDAEGNLDLMGNLTQIFTLTKKMGKVQRAQIIGDIFNLRGARPIQASIDDLDKIDKHIDIISKSMNESRLAAAKMESGLGGALRRATSAVDAINIALGFLVTKRAQAVLNFFTAIADKIEALVPKSEKLIISLLAMPVVFAAIFVGATTLSFVFARLASVIGMLSTALKGLRNVGGVMAQSAKALIPGKKFGQSTVARASANISALGQSIELKKERDFYRKKIAVYTAYAIKQRRLEQYYATIAAIQARRGFNNRAALNARQLAKIRGANAASRIGMSTKLLEGIKGGFTLGNTISNAAKGIGLLTLSFTKLTLGFTRFLFSWNFVGLALNALLLFGHKIPAVAAVFKSLGEGISGAFEQLGKIGTYAAPVFDLIRLAFSAFASGDSAIGLDAIGAAMTGLVDIISNQLNAAWNTFLEKTTYIWSTLQMIGTSLSVIFDSIVDSISAIVGAWATMSFDNLSKIGKNIFGESDSTLMDWVKWLAQSIDYLITGFGNLVVDLMTWGQMFTSGLQIMFSRVIAELPGSSLLSDPTALQKDAADAINKAGAIAKASRDTLNAGYEARKEKLDKAFSDDDFWNKVERGIAAGKANQNSSSTQNSLTTLLAEITRDLETARAKRTAEEAALQQEQAATKAQPGIATPPAQEIKGYMLAAASLVGSIVSTRNKLILEAPKMIDEQKKTNELLGDIKDNLQINGAF